MPEISGKPRDKAFRNTPQGLHRHVLNESLYELGHQLYPVLDSRGPRYTDLECTVPVKQLLGYAHCIEGSMNAIGSQTIAIILWPQGQGTHNLE